MDAPIPKQYLPLCGKPVLRHTIEKFAEFPLVQCVMGEGHDDLYAQAVEGLDILPPVYGGSTRQESVKKGLQALKAHTPRLVLIHDAARPCINSQDIHKLIHRLEHCDAATLAMPVNETLHRDGVPIDRDNVWMIQTPQGFDFKKILAAHVSTDHNFTDDLSLFRACYPNDSFEYVSCGRHNIKITTQDDLTMAEHLLRNTMETRVGSGFDVHAFSEGEAKSIRLCGIDIPYSRSLSGHSDADVGLHALTDAILGALGEGDIGTHFPPSDDNFKNMDSHVFLDKSVDMLRARGGKLVHMDLTIIGERPKIRPFQEEIKNHLADYLKLSTDRVSIKATTTERLGFTGREEGLAAQATVTIQVPAS